ncbi:damage-inducible protein DinB [Pedobacter sp. KBW06]|uniref:DinB family protein n=1 Tax=Pedobacter sp. KBW06 TaxID=2153359 RepID=UPI000F5B4888|nr:DinB family protein [Pedobacter sp. KBW06]RQO74842.1 damage-inducible protein DinB [Pedobacter sp. KBW06]
MKQLFSSLSDQSKQIENVLLLFKQEQLPWTPESWDGIPGERFSAIEQICHIRDIETDGYHHRIQRILKEHNPTLAPVEGYELAIQRDYKNADLQETIAAFLEARKKTVAMIGEIEDTQWDRPAYFEGYGNITLRSLIHFLCSHDLEHLASLRWLLGKMG